MNALLRFTAVAFFLAGLLTVGILGTSTTLTFVWPGYLVIGLAGLASIIAIFSRNKFNIPYWCIGSVFLVAGYLLLRAMNSPVIYFAREDGVLLVTCFIVYMIFLSLIDSARWRQGLFWTILALLSFNIVLAVMQLVKGGDFWIMSNYGRTFSERVGGVFNHPEHFGGFMAIGVVYLASLAVFGHHSKLKGSLLICFAVLCMAMIVIAESLLGMLAVGVGLTCLASVALLLAWNNFSSTGRKYSIGLFLLSFIAVAAVVGVNYSKIKDGVMTRNGQIGVANAWSSGLEQFAESPLAGTGSRTSYFYNRRFHPGGEKFATESESEFIHNEYIQALADYGLVGFLLIVGLVLAHLYNGFRFVRGYARFPTPSGKILPKSNHLAFVVAALTGVVSLGFLSCFDFIMHIPAIAVFAALFLGFLACPDPMSRALHVKEDRDRSLVPGGGLLFAGRSVAVGAGLGLLIFSIVFGRSEWHLEMARVKYDSGKVDTEQLDHLAKARAYDSSNPFIMSLSGHSYVRAIRPDMTVAERTAYLEKANQFFNKAEKLYPQDINRAIAHSVVLDALGRSDEAGGKLVEAREWAPLYGNLMLAQGEHFLRKKQYSKAERSFRMARNSSLYQDNEAIDRGLAAIANWKGIDAEGSLVNNSKQVPKVVESLMKEGKVEELEISGEIGSAIDESLEMIEKKLDGVGNAESKPVAPKRRTGVGAAAAARAKAQAAARAKAKAAAERAKAKAADAKKAVQKAVSQ